MAPDVSGRLPGRFGDRRRSSTAPLAAGGQPAAGRAGAQYRRRPVRAHADRRRANASGRTSSTARSPTRWTAWRRSWPASTPEASPLDRPPSGWGRRRSTSRPRPSPARRPRPLADRPLCRRRRPAAAAHAWRPRRGRDELGPRAPGRGPDGRREAVRSRRRGAAVPGHPVRSLPALGQWLTERRWVSLSHELPITRRFWRDVLGRSFATDLPARRPRPTIPSPRPSSPGWG